MEVILRENIDDWFVENVLVFEPELTGYLRKNWKNQSDVAGLRQEVYVRVFQSALKKLPTHCRSFLFATARNLLIDRARRATVVSIDTVADLEQLAVPSEQPTADEIVSFRQEVISLKRALSSLPPRCRKIVEMRKIEGLPQRQVATSLGITQGTVEKQLSKGIRLLANELYGKGGGFEDTGTTWSQKYIEKKK